MISSSRRVVLGLRAYSLQAALVHLFLLCMPLYAETLVPISPAFEHPVYVLSAKDSSGRLFVGEKAGVIRILKDGEILPVPFLDISRSVRTDFERGLLSFAFHPQFRRNRKLYVCYVDQAGDMVLASYKTSVVDKNRVKKPSRKVLLKIRHRASPYHYSGQLQFGPDGFLYVGVGDGGASGDSAGNAQNKGVLLGKILRIDVDHGSTYRIPSSNPFRGISGVKPEIFAYGFRNPWRFSFDPLSERLFVGDVGQDSIEEVDIVENGKNYGWNIQEAGSCFLSDSCDSAGLETPIIEYTHDSGSRSVIGGHVYHGSLLPSLVGKYIYGDFVSGKVWAAAEDGNSGVWTSGLLIDSDLKISSFGLTQTGEILVVDYMSGILYRLDS